MGPEAVRFPIQLAAGHSWQLGNLTSPAADKGSLSNPSVAARLRPGPPTARPTFGSAHLRPGRLRPGPPTAWWGVVTSDPGGASRTRSASQLCPGWCHDPGNDPGNDLGNDPGNDPCNTPTHHQAVAARFCAATSGGTPRQCTEHFACLARPCPACLARPGLPCSAKLARPGD